MSRLGSFTRYWLPLALWMALIFTASTDALSSSRTSRIIGPFLRWIYPGVSNLAIYRVQTVVRKGGHVAEYAVLALLVWRTLRRPQRSNPRPWQWSHAGVALLVAVGFAASDEWHQSFVPSRDGRVKDVLWDSAGAAAGLAGLWSLGRWKKRW